MRSLLVCLFSLIASCCQLSAQVFPKEGSALCYRLIGFSFPAEAGATQYKIEVATGTYATVNDFDKKVGSTMPSKSNRLIAEVPSFGSHYTWRTVSYANGKVKAKSDLHHFSTMIVPDVDAKVTRLSITKGAEKYKDAYVFVDETRALYDMKGRPVWFLPWAKGANQTTDPRDIKITSQGTITFIQECQPHEVNYNGEPVWQYKGHITSSTLDTFHHEFVRLNNGHYMGMVLDNVFLKRPLFKDEIARNRADTEKFYQDIQYNKIVELNEKGEVVWQWNGLDYIEHSDLAFTANSDLPNTDLNFHQNAFYFDEAKKIILLSFRDVWRVLKIGYPEGNVINTYGPLYHQNDSVLESGPFCYQHGCKISRKGDLYLFNNNQCGTPPVPTIMVLHETKPGSNALKKIWEYKCTIEDPQVASMKNLKFISGGNVLELADGSMFVSMGAPYCKLFIVGYDKKILWSAIPERYEAQTRKWQAVNVLYRASIITNRKDLENLIWNSEKG